MSVFADEWRACMRAHYMYVIRTGDRITEQSLTSVMIEIGFGEDELRELRVLATMHVEDTPDGFEPDFKELEAETQQQVVAVDVTEALAEAEEEPQTALDAAGELLELEDGDEPEDQPPLEEDPDAPEQLSLF